MRGRLRKKLLRRRVASRFATLYLYARAKLREQGFMGTPEEMRLAALAILFRADLRSYEQTGYSLTGASWWKGEEGPLPGWPTRETPSLPQRTGQIPR